MLIASGILIVVLTILITTFCNAIISSDREYKDTLNQTVIIDKDTLTVVDYDIFEGVLILNNGRKINKDFINASKQ